MEEERNQTAWAKPGPAESEEFMIEPLKRTEEERKRAEAHLRAFQESLRNLSPEERAEMDRLRREMEESGLFDLTHPDPEEEGTHL